MKQIDLNCDMGESYGVYQSSNDDEIIKLVSSVNVACGYHGGDPDVMDHTIALAKKYNVGVGAHPGYPNLQGFGRWNMDIPSTTLSNMILYQIGALDVFCKKYDVEMKHVKPHGNLNNMADHDEDISGSIVEAVHALNPDLPIYVKPNSALQRIATQKGQPVILELFADRSYHKDMTLVSRQEEGAVITDVNEVAHNVIKMIKEKKVMTITGEEITIKGESLCVHGDTPAALQMIMAIRKVLAKENITIRSPR